MKHTLRLSTKFAKRRNWWEPYEITHILVNQECGCEDGKDNIIRCELFTDKVKTDWFQGIRSDYVLHRYEDPVSLLDTVYCIHFVGELKIVYDLTNDSEFITDKTAKQFRSNINITELSESELTVFCFVVHELNPEYISLQHNNKTRFEFLKIPNSILVHVGLKRFNILSEEQVQSLIQTHEFKDQLSTLFQERNMKLIEETEDDDTDNSDKSLNVYLLYPGEKDMSYYSKRILPTKPKKRWYPQGWPIRWINLTKRYCIPSITLDRIRGKSFDDFIDECRENKKPEDENPMHLSEAKLIDDARPTLGINELKPNIYKFLLNVLQDLKIIRCERYSTGETFKLEFNPP
jgi:hypothetical protein